jgi:membrane protease YdiL (CAAX protease family)
MDLFLNLLIDAIFIGGFILWGWIATRLWRRQTLLPYEPRRPVPWGAIDLVVVIGAFIFLQGLCLGVAVKWSGVEMPSNWTNLDPRARFVLLSGNLVATVLTLLAAALILPWQSGASRRDLGINLNRVPHDLRCGAIAFLAAAPAVFGLQRLITQWIPYQHQLVTAVQEKNDTAMWIVAALSAVLVAPVFEELFFRVLLQGWLEKIELSLVARTDQSGEGQIQTVDAEQPAASESTAADVPMGLFGLSQGMLPIVVSSTLFALMHWGQGGAPIPLFVLALVLGFLYQRTHRILPSLTVHMLLNSVSLAVFFLEPKA